jgi:two-component system, OmpR family, sensor kinase
MAPRSDFHSRYAPGSARWQALRQLPGRIPLRIKLITAVLTLVAIALMAISVAGVSFLRSYLLGQTDAYLETLLPGYGARAVNDCLLGYTVCPTTGNIIGTSVDWVLEGRTKVTHIYIPVSRVKAVIGPNGPGFDAQTEPGPAIQPVLHWLIYHPNQAITLPATSGDLRWRVVASPYSASSPSGHVTGDVIVGQDVTTVYNTLGKLISIDLIVSSIVLLALAIVGIAIVRSSLQPLTDIEFTARAIAAGDLSRRVPDRDARTEVGQLGRSLNTMLAQIEAAFYARAQSEAAARRSEERMRQFVADASHELRTPLTTIRGYAEYYRQRGGMANGAVTNGAAAASQPPAPGPAASSSEQAASSEQASGQAASGQGANGAGSEHLTTVDMDRIMERVEQESSRMGGLVEDMLLLARLDQQRPFDRRPVDLLTLAADAVQDARMIAPNRKVELTVGKGTAFLVLGDEARLRQVISNLMSNALTHTPDGTEIQVRVLAGGQGQPAPPGQAAPPTVVLEVADRGPGMTADQADRVFERFYRADQARDRRTGGTGLGLAIVHALVTAHGGTVTLATAPGQGATFRITLPLAPEAQTPQAQPEQAPAQDD